MKNLNRNFTIMNFWRLFFVCWIALLAPGLANSAKADTGGQVQPGYEDLVIKAQAAFKSGDYLEANSSAMQAIGINPDRFEAYLVAATAQWKSGRTEQAKSYIDQAIKKAPDAKKEKLQNIAQQIAGGAVSGQFVSVDSLPTDIRRKYDALLYIVQEADGANSVGQRYKTLNEFLNSSATFLEKNNVVELWVLRAGIALEMDDTTMRVDYGTGDVRDKKPWEWLGYTPEKIASIGWNAGKQLIASGSSDSKIHDLLVKLERKNWLEDRDPLVVAEEKRKAAELAQIESEKKKRTSAA